MKSFFKQNKSLCIFLIVALIFALIGLIFGKGDELIYMIFVNYLIIPITAFICSIGSVKKGTASGFLAPFVFVAVASVIPFTVFGATDIAFFLFALVPCAIGFVIGFIAYVISKAKKSK